MLELLEVSRARWGVATILPKGAAIQRRDRLLAGDVGEVHVTLGGSQVSVTGEGLGWDAAHGEVRAEGVPEHVRASGVEPRGVLGCEQPVADRALGGRGDAPGVPCTTLPYTMSLAPVLHLRANEKTSDCETSAAIQGLCIIFID